MCWLPQDLAGALREVYEVEEFHLGFYLGTMEEIRDANFQAQGIQTKAEVTKGYYDFLPCPPVVFSRTLATYGYLDHEL